MKPYAKAIIGAIIAFLSTAAGILSAPPHTITLNGWLVAALGAFAGLNGVWAVPNTPIKPPVPPTT